MKADESRLKFMPFNTRDWLSSPTVLAMRPAARGIYIHLLAIQWDTGSLPIDVRELRQMAGADRKEWALFETHLEKVLPQCGDTRMNQKLNDERTKAHALYEAKCEQNRLNGQNGGRPPGSKKSGKNKPSGLPDGIQVGTESKPSGNPEETLINNKQVLQVIHKEAGASISFDDFILKLADVYPENRGRKIPQATQVKLKTILTKDSPDEIIHGAEQYAAHRAWLRAAGKFCPSVKNIQTWVNQMCWKDEYEIGQIKSAAPGRAAVPRQGVDFEIHHDTASDKFLKVIPGTLDLFDAEAWQVAA